jgi:protein-S-isoprenylcysteine O-methyltransferase Ste14
MIPNLTLLVLLLANFAMIGLLPLCFFRRDGQLNLRWLGTALPFFVVPAALVPGFAGRSDAWTAPASLAAALDVGATLASVASIALLSVTVGAHRIPLALWHQENDAPAELVMHGPYRRVRHPFYTSFLLALLAAAAALPNVLTLGSLAWASVALNATARREERRLTASAFGPEYTRDLEGTGRFLPRWTP